MVGNGIPEVMILRGIGVAQGDVADDAEGDEGDVVEVARLGNGARLHIDGLGFGEVAEDVAHLVLGIDKPVAGDDETRMKADV